MRDVEIPSWLQELPLAPEFHPTDTEFADPIAYISKIEKQASAFGICKVIPPLPKPSRKYVISNLNRSLSKSPELFSDHPADLCSSPKLEGGDLSKSGVVQAIFTTRQQELGQNLKRARGSVQVHPSALHKQVWQSGENYTIEQFESKSKAFARSVLGTMKEVSPLAVETLFWKADSEKPIYLEYANDVPGSGFGEAQGLFRYFHRRRRKINFNRNISVQVSPKNDEIDSKAKSNPSSDPSKPSTFPLGLLYDKMCLDVDNDMQGSAGWKLSNSPWNLQIISRSAGSLTRFMPDDIPGVTSPMVYIGMLFSWFAWHIEDHELHSLNFLHTGSPKTWYAVPAKYASAFEDVICKRVYRGNLDLLDSISLLGEKTTLVSPEVVVSAGIPCCRLIQNPGEFVVTFPRAYHVGFSHGFNCGEAANFGTPQWLKVAKEAAVRRAAMNYLPMLSHQQLLYLLTMSFASRVPRSLLPGARSSRLRDRQKEEREQLVKKAFIKDMLNENKFASVLLEKQTTYCAALWNPDSLPSSSKYTPTLDDLCVPSENEQKNNTLFDEMTSYMESVNDLYTDDTDLYTDFQVDSATLACVACGILGFPFMCILQPSDREVMEHLQVGSLSVQECDRVIKTHNSSLSDSNQRDTEDSKCKCCGTGRDLDLIKDEEMNGINLLHHALICSITELNEGWNTCCGILRPRIFCLEHAIQIEELLQSKGGANLLVICHSDYQKIKAHSKEIAEEIGSCFDYNDIPLEKASPENLNLINLAIDKEEHHEQGDDWTSKLGINLNHCINVKKKTPSKQLNHALRLCGLFSESTTAISKSANLNWKSRRSRSKHITVHPHKLCESIPLQNLLAEKIIQYSRRRIKSKQNLPGNPKSEEENGFKCKQSLPGNPKSGEKNELECKQNLTGNPKYEEKNEFKCMENLPGNPNSEEKNQFKCKQNLPGNPRSEEKNGFISSEMCQETEGYDGHENDEATKKKALRRKRKESEKMGRDGYIRSPCEGLRPRCVSSSSNCKIEKKVKKC